MADLKSKTPTETLDLLGTVCPYPIITTKKEMGKLPNGAILKIICDVPAFVEETIPRFAEMRGYQYETVRLADKGYWEIYIQKTSKGRRAKG
jgi:tRNA 2-thiouridine synthesizing protein A